MFGRLADTSYLDAFVALVTAGLLLGALRYRDGCIAGAVACHATWVAAIQLMKKTTTWAPGAWGSVWVSRYDGIIGWPFAAVVLALFGWLVWRGALTSRRVQP